MTSQPTAPPAPRTGLTAAEVAERVADGRSNDLPSSTGRSRWEIVRANVFTRINFILGVLLAIVLTTGSIINAAFGLLIIFNSAVGIIQELRAKKTLDNLAVVGEAKPRVRRDGESREIHRTEVVQDDVIELGQGDQLIVDGEVVEAGSLEVDESLLTGEADPVVKHPGDEVLSGSFVVAGSGAYRATKVGRDAYAARLVEEASKFTLVNSELRTGIDKILGVVSILLVPVGLLTIYTQLVSVDAGWKDAVLGMVGALVPMVPEGLVLMTSIAFAVGVVRLGKRQCLVQELPAIEGLARVDVVCADKTGTLTENGMRLKELVPLAASTGAAEALLEEIEQILGQLAATEPNPNASLQAIVEGVRPLDGARWTEAEHAPFTSAKKWSGSTFDTEGSWVLGAPDVLAPPDSDAGARAEEIGSTGLRVLLLGRASEPVTSADAPGVVEPTALVVLEQRVRPDAGETIDYFHRQDVEVKVISGDNAVSVGAVTAGLGVRGGDQPVDARTLGDPEVPDAAFADTIDEHSVFGRVTPDQKRAMVLALQEKGHTVAMTGDGVNDVLALKDADIGVSMGSGSPATRAVAQIVLLDNKFATLPYVVAEGRRVIGNIERVANLFLTKTVYSVLLALLVGIWQWAFPLQPIHVTLTSWFTIGIPAFLLSLAPNHERAQPGFAKRVLRLALPSGIIVGIASFITYAMVHPGKDPGEVAKLQASTAVLATLIVVATWVLAVVARPYRPWKLGLILMSVVAYGVIFSVPWLQETLKLDSGNGGQMRDALLVGLVGAVLVEAVWWFFRLRGDTSRRFWDSGRDDEDEHEHATPATGTAAG